MTVKVELTVNGTELEEKTFVKWVKFLLNDCQGYEMPMNGKLTIDDTVSIIKLSNVIDVRVMK